MSTSWQIRIHENHHHLHSASITGSLELGRQNDALELLYALKPSGDRFRMAIARLQEAGFSRKHLLITPLSSSRVQLENLSNALPVVIIPMEELSPGSTRDVELPAKLGIGEIVISLEEAGPSDESLQFRSLRQATPLLNSTTTPAWLVSGKKNLKSQMDTQEMMDAIQLIMGVFLSAATSYDFYSKAARAVVEIVGLDTGSVLILDNDTWRSEAIHRASQANTETDWKASQSVLTRVVEEKRTYWQVPPAAASLKDIKAVVASPILSARGDVVAVLYGDSRLDSSNLKNDLISELQASLVDLLASGVAAGLARVTQEEAVLAARVQFEQFFTPELAQELAVNPRLLDGQDVEVTVLFCDIRGFSGFSENLGPSRTMAWIADVMETFSQCVQSENGVLVDYIGDELIAMWGAPRPTPNHAVLACKAACAMIASLPEINQRWTSDLGKPMTVGIGINSGIARVGNMGSKRKFKYGPLGNMVNLASRVQGATKYLKCPILITGATQNRIQDQFAIRRLCTARVVNIQEPVPLFELAIENQPDWTEAKEEYEKALEAFEARNFHIAARILGNWRLAHPNDGPSLVLLGRAVNSMITENETFDPVWVLPGK